MSISKIVTAALLCLLIISCGGDGKKNEPARSDKRKIEIIEKKKKATADEAKDVERESRNNGNHRKPTKREKGESKLHRKRKGRAVVQPEEDPAKVSAAKIEKRIRLEIDIWEAKKKNAAPREIVDIARAADAEMRELVDGVMGAGTCDAQFCDMSVFAMAEGLPVWANLLFAIIDRCEAEAVEQQKLSRPRLAKYTAKYGKK